VLASTRDAGVRETIRDLASAKAFRRDLWRKGGEQLPAPEQTAMLDAMTLTWTGKAMDGPIVFAGPVGEVTGQHEFYRPIVDALIRGPVTIGALRALPQLQGRAFSEFAQAAFLLIGGALAHPAWPAGAQRNARESAARLNTAIIGRLRAGTDLLRLAAPVTGSSVPVSVLEGLTIGRILEGTPPEAESLIEPVYDDLARSGRSLVRDGQPLGDSADARAMIGGSIRELLTRRLPLLRADGVIA
jgi:hypothetical protein